MEHKNVWKKYTPDDLECMETFAKSYRDFLDHGKTERECTSRCIQIAKKNGFKALDSFNGTLKAGDRVYVNWMNKCFMAFVIGSDPISNGLTLLGAHIDSPRIDIKPNPLYEDTGFAYLDTHYYGGIKKFHWVAQPLALHGVVVLRNGETVPVCIGEKEDDPVFCISDLLIHLSGEQMKKDGGSIIAGEDLNLLVGHRPERVEKADDEKKEKDLIKKNVLNILKDSMNIEEEDFLSAELEIVPAGHTRDMGLDRSMILGYGHDDRVCAYPSMRAVIDFAGTPRRTLGCILTDKEETGSLGATGMNSQYFENTVAELLDHAEVFSEIALRRTLRNSYMLSSDVSAGFDPLYPSVFEKKNAAFLGDGICFNKYTGSRGKSGTSDANAEYVAKIRKIMDEAEVSYQFAELGAVDAGGGGTICHTCAKYGMNVIDAGVAVLSMHAPYEVISKADLYETYRGYCAFLSRIQ